MIVKFDSKYKQKSRTINEKDFILYTVARIKQLIWNTFSCLNRLFPLRRRNPRWKLLIKLISYILGIKNEENCFFTIVFSFKLKKYQHNKGEAACNLCSNFPGTYLQRFPIKQRKPPPLPSVFVKVVEIIQKNHTFQCFAPCFTLLIFQPCWFKRNIAC